MKNIYLDYLLISFTTIISMYSIKFSSSKKRKRFWKKQM